MSVASLFIIVVILFLLGTLVWWLLITTEGVYLGRGVVIWLYDVYAKRYDSIKCYDREWEGETLAQPILRWLHDIPAPLILDVATGTARLPLTMLDQPEFKGHLVGLDYSLKMLTVAAEKLADSGVDLIYQSAEKLPFEDNTFDAVTCLEALEFMPNPDAVIGELIRVARSGALIFDHEPARTPARLMPFKTRSTVAAGLRVRDHFGLEDVSIARWQGDYDQVRGFKPGKPIPAPDHRLEAILCCPVCQHKTLNRAAVGQNELLCTDCKASVSVAPDGVILYAKT